MVWVPEARAEGPARPLGTRLESGRGQWLVVVVVVAVVVAVVVTAAA